MVSFIECDPPKKLGQKEPSLLSEWKLALYLRGGTDFRNFDYCELAAGHSVPEGGEMRQPRGAYPEGVRGVGDLESTSLF